jgi:hypothetical protein
LLVRRLRKPPEGFDTGITGVLAPVFPFAIDDAADDVPLAGVCVPLTGTDVATFATEGFRETDGV